jgi:hypothetical protein
MGGQLGERRAPGFKRRPEVGRFASQLRRLRFPKSFARVQQPIERDAMFPEQLIHGPRGDRRLRERFDSFGVVSGSRLFQTRCQSVAGGCEFRKRQLKQRVDVVFGALFTFQLFHLSLTFHFLFSTFNLREAPDLVCHTRPIQLRSESEVRGQKPEVRNEKSENRNGSP